MAIDIAHINASAHQQTSHAGALDWRRAAEPAEIEFLSRMLFERPGEHTKARAYVCKELAQLAELEKHVSAVMMIVLAELTRSAYPLSEGHQLHHALTCFAAEETHHANMFHRYVREIAGVDMTFADNLFTERLALFEGDDDPMVKLAALCCTAYVGESLITVFEQRACAFDPDESRFFTQLLTVHGWDEARHIQTDHFVFDHVIPSLTPAELRRMRQIVQATDALNIELGQRFTDFVNVRFRTDFREDNPAWSMHMRMAKAFHDAVFAGTLPRHLDTALDTAEKAVVFAFSRRDFIHHVA